MGEILGLYLDYSKYFSLFLHKIICCEYLFGEAIHIDMHYT